MNPDVLTASEWTCWHRHGPDPCECGFDKAELARKAGYPMNSDSDTSPVTDSPENDASEPELDDIMEDLAAGHNFDYARKALLAWRDKAVEEALLDVALFEAGISPCRSCYCMTKTIEGKCGKCGAAKEEVQGRAFDSAEAIRRIRAYASEYHIERLKDFIKTTDETMIDQCWIAMRRRIDDAIKAEEEKQ